MAHRHNHTSNDQGQLLVQTPFGRGLIVRTRSSKSRCDESKGHIKEIRLLDWEHGSKNERTTPTRVPMLYTTTNYPSISIQKGMDVSTPYGRGIVKEFVLVRIRKRKRDNTYHDEKVLKKYHILLTSWRLEGRSRVVCFLFSSQIKAVRPKTLLEMDPMERVDFAMKQKQIAGQRFAEKHHEIALRKYAEAIDAVRYVQHTRQNSNECRADLLLVIVTCSNNAGTCCFQLGKFDEAIRFAKNALILLNALYGKRGMKIHNILLTDHNLSDSKIFGEWRAKSCLIIARAETSKKTFDAAKLREAKIYISEYMNKELNTDQKRLKDIMKEVAKIKNSIITEKQKYFEEEKAKAKKMFCTNSSRKTEQLQSIQSNKQCPTTYDNQNSSIHRNKKELKKSYNASTITKKDKSPAQARKKAIKRVSFAEKLEECHVLKSEVDIVDEEEEEPWYEEHKEALVLLTIGGLAFMTTIFGIRKK
jgi:tetratricopeptide (TPR) repeat protein